MSKPSNAAFPDLGESAVSKKLLDPLNDLQALAHQLFLSLSPPQTKPPPPPPFNAFLDCDRALAAAVDLAYTHQVKQRKIDALEADILDLDAQWREICTELAKGKAELEEIIKEGDERIKAIEEAKAASVPYPELLAYAQRISSFTSAPPHLPDAKSQLSSGQAIFPPFPLEENLRRGHLNAEAPLGILGEIHSVRPPTVSPKVDPLQNNLPGANPYRQDLRAPRTQFFDLDLDLNPDL